MPGSKKPGPSVKKPHMYEGLRNAGFDQESAARISNAQAKKDKQKKGG